MRYVTCYGALYNLTEHQWTKWLRSVAGGYNSRLPGVLVVTELINVTDMDTAVAQHLLDSPDDHRNPHHPEWHMSQ